jgi:hypothetical protein
VVEWKPDLSELRLSGAFIIRGDVNALKQFLEGLKAALDRHGLELVFQTFSSERLRVVREVDYKEVRR